MRLDSIFIHHIHIALWYNRGKQFQYFSSSPSQNFRLLHDQETKLLDYKLMTLIPYALVISQII